ncbi:hypothetical protein Sjap_000554 [Stephania japonica]|uniref:Probable purine permease n=1 Tax=Stephania japonica TaxID=461633 RepID=A0AAP0KKH3_9MAGN
MASPLHHHNKQTTPPNSSQMTDDQLRQKEAPPTKNKSNMMITTNNWILLSIYLTCVTVGGVGAPLLQRLYYNHGGNRKWFMCFLQTVAFPFLTIPLAVLGAASPKAVITMEPRLFHSGVFLGLTSGALSYMNSLGLFYLPVSTFTLISCSNLAFLALFSFLIVKQKFTFYSLNAVVLLTLGALVLALHSSGDRPQGVSKGQYLLGFSVTLGASVAAGALFPLIELTYRTCRTPVDAVAVTQFQLIMNLFSTVICTLGMIINNDFQVIKREAAEFGLGEAKYYVVVVALAVFWQLLTVGMIGLVHCTSSLFSGITSSIMVPILLVAGVITFNEKFTGEKGMSLALCVWGFVSYFLGEYKTVNKEAQANELDNKEVHANELDNGEA